MTCCYLLHGCCREKHHSKVGMNVSARDQLMAAVVLLLGHIAILHSYKDVTVLLMFEC